MLLVIKQVMYKYNTGRVKYFHERQQPAICLANSYTFPHSIHGQ